MCTSGVYLFICLFVSFFFLWATIEKHVRADCVRFTFFTSFCFFVFSPPAIFAGPGCWRHRGRGQREDVWEGPGAERGRASVQQRPQVHGGEVLHPQWKVTEPRIEWLVGSLFVIWCGWVGC